MFVTKKKMWSFIDELQQKIVDRDKEIRELRVEIEAKDEFIRQKDEEFRSNEKLYAEIINTFKDKEKTYEDILCEKNREIDALKQTCDILDSGYMELQTRLASVMAEPVECMV